MHLFAWATGTMNYFAFKLNIYYHPIEQGLRPHLATYSTFQPIVLLMDHTLYECGRFCSASTGEMANTALTNGDQCAGRLVADMEWFELSRVGQ